MASPIFDLIRDNLLDLLGSPELFGFVLLFILIIMFACLDLPFLSIAVILAGFIWGIVEVGWLPIWAKGILMIILGVVFFYSIYQTFKT